MVAVFRFSGLSEIRSGSGAAASLTLFDTSRISSSGAAVGCARSASTISRGGSITSRRHDVIIGPGVASAILQSANILVSAGRL